VTREDDLSGDEGEATFLLKGSLLTIAFREPWGTSRRIRRERRLNQRSDSGRHDRLAFLACFPRPDDRRAPPWPVVPRFYRLIVVPAGTRTLTADLELEIGERGADCLLENVVNGEEIVARF
jgi:hypothetical protein